MMIKDLFVTNFKSWRLLGIGCGQITALFGTNSSGKSSLLQFLLMLKQTKETVDRSLALDLGSTKNYTNLGTFHDVVFKHADEMTVSWTLKWTLKDRLEITDTLSSRNDIIFDGNEMQITAEVGLRNSQIRTNFLNYEFSGQNFLINRKESRSSAFTVDTNGTNIDFRFVRKLGRAWDIPGPVKSYAFPDQAKTYYQNSALLSDLEYSYEELMDSIYYLGPLRDYPKREYIWSGSSPIDVGFRGERVVDALLAARSRGEMRNLGYKRKKIPFDAIIAHWLKELGLIHSFKVVEIAKNSNLYKVQVQKDASSAPVLITDVGFGVSQFLPVLVLLYYVPEGSIVLLEQPEIHLHPAVQSGLADVIINVAKNRNLQVIVESHSEHLLRRLQRRIAEGELSEKETKIYFCRTEEGESKLEPLGINMFGEIENWPPNFFGDELGEIIKIKQAGLERKIANK